MQASQPPQQPGGRGKTAGSRGSGRGTQSQMNKKGPESHPLPNGTPSPTPEPVAPSGGMSWAARVASAASAKPAPPAPNGNAAEGPLVPAPPAPSAPPIAPPAAAPAANIAPQTAASAGVKLPPGVEGRQASIKFGDIDPTEVAKEQAAPVAPAPAPPKPAAPAAPAAPAPTATQQQPGPAAPLPSAPAAAQSQRPGSFAAAAATGPKPSTSAAAPAMMPQQVQGMAQPVQARQQHGSGPRGGQGRGLGGQQQPGVGMNPAAMGMYAQQYGMPAAAAAFSMNPGAATFGPGGMVYMPGGPGYFTAQQGYPQPWQGAQYQYGMNPAAMQAGGGGQQGMPASSGMTGPQASASAAPYPPTAGAAPKPTTVTTPVREKRVLRLENPLTHEVIDLSKVAAEGKAPTADAADAPPAPAKPADQKPAAAEAKQAEVPKAEAAGTGAAPSKSASEAAAAEAAAAAALKPKAEAAEAPAVAATTPTATAAANGPAAAPPAAATPVSTSNLSDAPAAAPAAAAAAPAAGPAPAAAAAAPAAAPAPQAASTAAAAAPAASKWGKGPSFKEKLMVDPAEKKRQEEEARKKAAEEEAALKAAEDAKRKAEEEKQAAEEAARKKAAEDEAARKAAEEAKRKDEEEAAAKKKADEEAAAFAAKEAAEKEAAAKEAAAKEAAAKEVAAKEAAAKEAAAKEAAREVAAKEAAVAANAAAAASKAPAVKTQAEEPAAAPASDGPSVEQSEAAIAPATEPAEGNGKPDISMSPFSSAGIEMEEGEIVEEEREEESEPPTGFESDTSGRKRYDCAFLFYYGNKCREVPKGIEAETFKQLSRENAPPGPPMGGRGPRGGGAGGGGGFGGEERWQSGRMPSGPIPGPPGMRGDPRMMGRQASGRHKGGVEADQWERGKPLPPMPGMPPYDGRRGGPPPGMRMPSGPVPQLHKTDNAYKVGAVLTDDPAEEQAQKRLKSLLNKITKDNFAKITGQIVDVINERKLAKTLSGFINQIFDKALTETHFAELYADLVASLNPALPSLKDEEGNDVQFRRTLLNKCQEEFEAGATAMKAVSEREKHAKESGEAPPEDGQEDDEDKEEEEKEEEKKDEEELGEVDEAKAKHDAEVAAKKAELAARKEERRKAQAELQARKRMLGNIVFVGQLFKKGVLTETVMHTCIKQLLEEVGSPKPEDVECMCKLLATVGGILDASTKQVKNFNNGKPASTKEVMNVYFGRIETLSRNEALDSRHRFMLLDLIDQRRNRWRPRKEAEGPKTIEEIHREEAMKRTRSAMLDRQASGRDSFRGPRGGPPPGRPPFDNRVDAPIRTMNRVGSNDVLGPGGPQSLRPGGRPGPQRGSDRPGSGPPERQPSLRQQGPPAPPSRADRGAEAPAAPAAKEEPASSGPLDEAKLRSEAKSLLVELYNSGDVKEGATRVKELLELGAEVAPLFDVLLMESLEGKGTNWEWLGAVLRSCVEQKLLPAADLERAARSLLDALDDLSVDVPKAPLQVGSVLGDLVAAGGADLKALAQHIRTADANPDEIQEGEDTMLVSGGGAAKTLGRLLQRLVELKGEEAAREAWAATGEQLAAFLPDGDREDEAAVKALVDKFGLASIGC